MFLAELAILFDFDSVGIVLLVFVRPVIAILTFGAGQSDFHAHDLFPPVAILIFRQRRLCQLPKFLIKNKTPSSGAFAVKIGGGTEI